MTDLLAHSMAEFGDLILDALACAEVRHIAEIGAEFGGMSQRLADYAEMVGGSLTSIDPCPKESFVRWARNNPVVRHLSAPSLDVLPHLDGIDAWVIDGDHNYFTVFHELQAADASCARTNRPLLALLHDVSWPTARRDMYYSPDRIPPAWRHPYCWDGGVTLDGPDLLPGRGFRGAGQFAWATHIGGPRNGVLTAVEDFIAEQDRLGRKLAWAEIPAVFGLGILFDVDTSWSAELATLVHPYHGNSLLASMEANRLRNYLAVLDWQDRFAELEERAGLHPADAS